VLCRVPRALADTATPDDIRRFQLDQHEKGVGPATINGAVSALRFLLLVTLQRRDLSRALVITRYHRKLPDVLSEEEAGRLLEAAPGLKYKAALGVAYGAGLRVSKVAHLKVDDVDSTRMLLPSREFSSKPSISNTAWPDRVTRDRSDGLHQFTSSPGSSEAAQCRAHWLRFRKQGGDHSSQAHHMREKS